MIRSVLRRNYRAYLPQTGSIQASRLPKRALIACAPIWNRHGNYIRCQSVSFSSSSNYDEPPNSLLDERQSQHHVKSDILDESHYPLGAMTVEEFLHLESKLRDLIAQRNQISRDSIEQSLGILCRLIQEHEANPDLLDEYEMKHWIVGKYPRCTKILDDILANWAQWWPKNSRDAADLAPEAMYELLDNLSSGSPPVQLHIKAYGVLINVATRSGNPAAAPMFAEKMLDRVMEDSTQNPMLRPSNIFFNLVLSAWSRSGLPEAPERVEALFNIMCSLYNDGIMEYPPDNATYIARMQAVEKGGKGDVPEKLAEMLQEMNNSRFDKVEPCTAAYRMVIHSLIRSQKPQSMEKAYALFVEIVQAYLSTGNEQAFVDEDLFSMMISTLAKERECEKAEEVFRLMKEFQESRGNKRFEPNTRALLGMIIAYSRSGKPSAPEKADAILSHLEELAKRKKTMVPKRGYYYDVIQALLHGKTLDGLNRAEELLARMVQHHLDGAPNLLPDKGLFDQLMLAWSRKTHEDAPYRAERILQTMHDVSVRLRSKRMAPDEKSCFIAMTAWSRSPDPNGPDRAEKLFLQMLQQFDGGDLTMKPSLMHYTTLVGTLARSRLPDGHARAQFLFQDVIARYEATGDKSLQPDNFLYTSMMRVWAKVGDAVTVESIFLEMYDRYAKTKQQKLMPTTMSFNVLLEAWIRSELPEAYSKATYVFDSMVDFTEENILPVAPDSYTFDLMIGMVANSGKPDSAEQAEKYLDLLKAAPILTDQRGHEKIFSCYVSAIGAWCQSKDDGAAAKAVALIDEVVALSKSRKIPLPSKSEHRRLLSVIAKSAVPKELVTGVQAMQVGKYKEDLYST